MAAKTLIHQLAASWNGTPTFTSVFNTGSIFKQTTESLILAYGPLNFPNPPLNHDDYIHVPNPGQQTVYIYDAIPLLLGCHSQHRDRCN